MAPPGRTQGREMHSTTTQAATIRREGGAGRPAPNRCCLGAWLRPCYRRRPARRIFGLPESSPSARMSIWTRRSAPGSIRRRHRASHRPRMGANVRLSRRERPRCYAPARAAAAAIWFSTRRRRATASERMRRTPSSRRRVRLGARPPTLSPGAGPSKSVKRNSRAVPVLKLRFPK